MRSGFGERGGALVEFAVVSPVVLIFLFGIIELGLLVYDLHTVGGAAALGARWAMTRGSLCAQTNTDNDAQGNAVCPSSANSIKDYLSGQVPGLKAGSLSVTPHWYTDSGHLTTCDTQDVGCVVNVQVTYPFTFSVPFVGNKVFNLSSTSEMTITD